MSFHRAILPKTSSSIIWNPDEHEELPLQRSMAWQSQGGYGRLHPARAMPLVLSGEIPAVPGRVDKLIFIGVFALYCDPQHESEGSPGASLQVIDATGQSLHFTLRNGTHYRDGFQMEPWDRTNADGSAVSTLGTVETPEGLARVDRLSIQLPPTTRPRKFAFRDLQTCASFLIFDAFVESVESPTCPFRGHGKGVTFHELSTALATKERKAFDQAVAQARQAILACHDLDEAKGAALLFVANVCSHALDSGAPRSGHHLMIEVARELDGIRNREEIGQVMNHHVDALAVTIFTRPAASTQDVVRVALEYVAQNYGKSLKDGDVANHLGLSTSHFRFLFKSQMGLPFHQYVLQYRLAKSREMLLKGSHSIHFVANSCGFASQAHFCRAFSKAFGVVPSNVRDARV